MRRLSAHFARRSGQRELASNFVITFGVLWLVFEPAGLFFPDELDLGWTGYIALIVISAAAAVWRARPRKTVTQALPPTDVNVEIRVGDVLEQSGNVVVGATDTFETQLEDGSLVTAVCKGNCSPRSSGATA